MKLVNYTTKIEPTQTIAEIRLDFPHQDDNNWLSIEAGGGKYPQYPSPLEVKMLIHQELQKAREDWYIGQRLNIFKGDYVVVGTSTMVYDEDCEGEPEWKITDEVQEVAIAQYYNDTSYQKPCWLKVTALQSELDQPIS